ncbi:hypothetical protein [Stenotrophomonas sp.]|uniref:hypothetical protein n=1 Tax=Stenotrophomonas sp. TaxID=69392 RepID=UPI002FCA0A05
MATGKYMANGATCMKMGVPIAHGPVAGSFPFLLVFLVSISAATGCTAMRDANTSNADPFRDQQSTADAEIQLKRWVTPNITVVDALQELGSRGFSCEATQPSSQGIESSILCLYSTPSSPPPAQRITAPATPINWFITLNSKDGATISDVQVARTPGEIGG